MESNWKDITKELPPKNSYAHEFQVPVLVFRKNRGIEVLVFNHRDNAFDDADGDDHECVIGSVSHWMELPKPPIRS